MSAVQDLQKTMTELIAAGGMEAAAIECEHYFSDGLYARKLIIPAGTVLVGKVHRLENFNIVSLGRISVAMGDEDATLIEAGAHIISAPGTKRAGFTHELTIWTTIHANPDNERDLDKLETRFILPESAQIDEERQHALFET